MSSSLNTLDYPQPASLIALGAIRYLVDQAVPPVGGEGCTGSGIINRHDIKCNKLLSAADRRSINLAHAVAARSGRRARQAFNYRSQRVSAARGASLRKHGGVFVNWGVLTGPL